MISHTLERGKKFSKYIKIPASTWERDLKLDFYHQVEVYNGGGYGNLFGVDGLIQDI